MHEHMTILGIALVILGYGYHSKLLNRYNISGPMIFALVGAILSFVGTEPIKPDANTVQTIAEIALITVLFSDAASINLAHLRREWRLPVRLLFVALPIMIVISFFAGKLLFPQESPLYILLLALLLAPTDAALGKAVVSDTRIPETVRNTINVESGLNDGIVFPVLLTVLAVISKGADGGGWGEYVAEQIAIGALAGGIAGWAGAKMAIFSDSRGWMEHQYKNLVPIALAIFSYYLAEHFGGNGYISAFFSGLILGNTDMELRKNIEDFAESEGELLIMVSFLVFGLVFIPISISHIDLQSWIYAIASLTLLRMVPVVMGFGFFKLSLPTRLFIGWFGPRGIASILYILVAVHQLGGIEGHEKIFTVATLTITLSILLHGLSARPLASVFARYVERRGGEI